MPLLVLAIVSIVAFPAMRLSMHIIYRCVDSVKSDQAKKTIRNAMFIISPILWAAIYFYPVYYGGPPRVFNLWVMFWSLKVILYFMTPALVAVLTALYLKSKNTES